MPRPANLLMFVGESHNRALVGAYGADAVRTPTLDALAARGALFRNSYCTSPICVPSRASLATGLYPHQSRYWENSIALDGRTPTWMKRARSAGLDVAGIGKFHFRNGEDDNGFSEEIASMHIAEGVGELIGLLRGTNEEPVRPGLWDLYTKRAGAGPETTYQAYDRKITRHSIDWLKARAHRRERPWVLCVHYVSAHAPYTVPQDLLDLYPLDRVPMPVRFRPDERPGHPAVQHLRRILGQPDTIDETLLRTLSAAYCATITHLDQQIGQVVAALADAGLVDDTRVVYTADHGYSHGNHFIFGLFNLYEHSVGVPLIMAGPDIPSGRRVEQIASHVDLFPTVLDGLGVPPHEQDRDLPGVSLWPAITGKEDRGRVGFAEYHALGSRNGAFMLREGSDKLLYHVGMQPQLFDLAADPQELCDLVLEGRGHRRAAELEQRLRTIVDPEAADHQAKADQRARAAELGGTAAILERRGGFVYSPPPGEDWRKI
ncbi:MAG: sulfatase-like hydrolase/transferase [Rhodospirillaceae bacterium]|nr:sulfatase-like hydrolase/transferase [Rhodospirillaceae bacterium]